MLSVILYGRNDSYGYNLHKRAAISLNCIAEMLSGRARRDHLRRLQHAERSAHVHRSDLRHPDTPCQVGLAGLACPSRSSPSPVRHPYPSRRTRGDLPQHRGPPVEPPKPLDSFHEHGHDLRSEKQGVRSHDCRERSCRRLLHSSPVRATGAVLGIVPPNRIQPRSSAPAINSGLRST